MQEVGGGEGDEDGDEEEEEGKERTSLGWKAGAEGDQEVL